jgi:hypothetical protein
MSAEPAASPASTREALGARAGSWLALALAALVALSFVVSLRDVSLSAMVSLGALGPAPRVPSELGPRDAAVEATVRDGDGHVVEGALVRVFVLDRGRVYFGGEARTGPDGKALVDELPSREAWVLAYREAGARASLSTPLAPGVREVTLVLAAASLLDVEVIDDDDELLAGATVTVKTTDPLPFVGVTGGEGFVRFARLPKAPFEVRADKPGYEAAVVRGVVPGGAPLVLRLSRSASLRVSVVDGAGLPAAGATLMIGGATIWPPRSTTTDAEGVALVTGLRASRYDLKAIWGDHVSATEVGIETLRGEVREVTLVVRPGRTLLVRVTDGEGDDAPGVPSASVVVVEDGLGTFPLEARAGPDGHALLGPFGDGAVVVSARAHGFVPRSAVRVPDEAEEVQIGLVLGGTIVGEVVDDRGFPVAGATLEVVGADAFGMPIDEVAALTEFRDVHFDRMLAGPRPLIPIGELGVMPGPLPDLPHGGAPVVATSGGDPWVTTRDGTFVAAPVTPGRVLVIARHPAHVEGTSELVTLSPGHEVHVRIVLREGGLLEGRVLEHDRTPVGGARVHLTSPEGSFETYALTADDGTFTFSAVPSEAQLSVYRPDSMGDPAIRLELDVSDRERRELEIVLPEPRGDVRLRVHDDRGFALSGVEVRALSLDPDADIRRTLFTDESGEAWLTDAATLPMRLVLVRPGRAPLVHDEAALPDELTLTMGDPVKLVGRVTSEGRAPLEGATVTVVGLAGHRQTKTDAEGRFELRDLAPGEVVVRVHAKGHVPLEQGEVLDGDRFHDAELGELSLAVGGVVVGVVLDERGDPVSGARVALGAVPSYLPLGSLPPFVTASDRKGRFSIEGVAEGEHVVEAALVDVGRGHESVSVRAGRSTDELRITLDPASAPRGDVKGAGSLAVTLGDRGRRVSLVYVPPGGEADYAGLMDGDELRSVNGLGVYSIEDARRLFTGPLGRDLVLEVERDGGLFVTRARRERVRR